MAKSKRNLSSSYLKFVKEKTGEICVNCGVSENIEYHHIVPLSLGGKERVSNIVPLCEKCHKAAHYGRHILHYREGKRGGRPSRATDEYAFEVFDLFASGKIGKKKCVELIGLSKSTHITDMAQYKKYLDVRGIEYIKNKIDLLGVNGVLKNGANVGAVKYKDGTIKTIIYNDDGANDIDYKIKSNVKIY